VQEYLDGDSLFAYLLLLRTADSRTILLLEGDDDCATLDPHIEQHEAQTIPAFARRHAERAVELAEENQIERVLGILDRNFSDLLGQEPSSQNIVLTDLYDLDATILFSSDVATRVVAVYTDRDAVQAHGTETGLAPLQCAVRMAAVLGSLRFISHRDGLSLFTRDLPIEAVVASSHDEVDASRLALIVASKSGGASLTAADIEGKLVGELPLEHPPERLCSGRDLAGIIAWLMRKKWGAGAVGKNNVAATIRAALSCDVLKASSLYREVQAWAEAHGTRVWSCV
jgi:hypothetical protein